jgi:hypothetical protein
MRRLESVVLTAQCLCIGKETEGPKVRATMPYTPEVVVAEFVVSFTKSFLPCYDCFFNIISATSTTFIYFVLGTIHHRGILHDIRNGPEYSIKDASCAPIKTADHTQQCKKVLMASNFH